MAIKLENWMKKDTKVNFMVRIEGEMFRKNGIITRTDTYSEQKKVIGVSYDHGPFPCSSHIPVENLNQGHLPESEVFP